MKNFKTIIILFAFLVVGIVGVAAAYTFVQGEQAKRAEVKYQQYVQKYKTQEAVPLKPTLTLTPTPQAAASATSLNTDLQGLSDDGGKSDFDQLQKDISGL